MAELNTDLKGHAQQLNKDTGAKFAEPARIFKVGVERLGVSERLR